MNARGCLDLVEILVAKDAQVCLGVLADLSRQAQDSKGLYHGRIEKLLPCKAIDALTLHNLQQRLAQSQLQKGAAHRTLHKVPLRGLPRASADCQHPVVTPEH